MIKKQINFLGKKYKISVVSDTNRNIFFIKALSIIDKKYSYINNLNFILSNLDITPDNPLISESQWGIPKNKIKLFAKKSIELLKDKESLLYLEKQLNWDRSYGEWENIQNKLK